MQIRFNDTLLADFGAESVSGFTLAGANGLQVAGGIRADEVEVFDRENHQTRIGFSVTRQHASVRHAETFLVEHALAVAGTGTFTFAFQGNERQRTERWLRGGVEACEGRHTGCTTFHRYQLVGGKLTSARPTA